MRQASETVFEHFQGAASGEYDALRTEADKKGYPFFYSFIETFKEKIKEAEEADLEALMALIGKARDVFPEPGRYSPSWGRIWDELETMVCRKQELMRSIPPEVREGEWQVIMDNPYTNEPIVCYPGLSFLEAAYLYAYFSPGLKKNEYIRVQKIQELFTRSGDSY